MGQTLPRRINMKSVAALKNATEFNKDEVRKLYRQFRKLSGGGYYIKKEHFFDGLKEVGLYTNDDSIPHPSAKFFNSMFEAFDHSNNGEIDLREFCVGLSVFASHRLHDTLEVAFDLYDLAGNEWITEGEMVEALTSMNRALELPQFSTDVSDNHLETADGIRHWVGNIVHRFDKTGNGKLNFEEFAAAVQEHPFLVQLASVFVTDVCHDFFHTPSRFMSSGASNTTHHGQIITDPLYNDVSGVPITDEQLKAAFARYDKDNNGFIMKAEFKQFYKSLDQMGVTEDPAAVDKLMAKYNMLGDDKLSFDEFAILMLKISQW
eukprot:TRINITY_DN13941_c0_g1_i1.p2 TRINITY_DN13941_c0_g1~~TRINITY_DN13941_c0_g1_i1.p2  ORF type:complete len:320 (-),score=39.92 TRINITY_DN13941_c0_g1_i1:1918-2877(-)